MNEGKRKYRILVCNPYNVRSESEIWAKRMAIIDPGGMIVHNVAGRIFIGFYKGRFSTRKAEEAAVQFANEDYGLDRNTVEPVLCTHRQFERRLAGRKSGGFDVFVVGECVEAERTFYMKELYVFTLGHHPIEEESSLTPVRTKGCDDDAIQQAIALYVNRAFGYSIEPRQVRITNAKELTRVKAEAP